MRLRPFLVIATAVLAAVHVSGVLLGRTLFRPAELLATLCLLAYALLATGLVGTASSQSGGPGAGGGIAVWGMPAAVLVLVIEAVLTVPPAPSDGAAGWQILSPEQYSGAAWRSLAENSAPGLAALIFVVVLLVAQRAVPRPARWIVLLAVAGAVFVTGYLALRLTEVVVDAGREPSADPAGVGGRVALVTVPPLLLALAALTFAVLSAARRRWRVAAGGVLLAATALPWMDAVIGAVPLPYAIFGVGGDSALFSWDAITPSVVLPQPVPALTLALQFTAYLLVVTGSAVGFGEHGPGRARLP